MNADIIWLKFHQTWLYTNYKLRLEKQHVKISSCLSLLNACHWQAQIVICKGSILPQAETQKRQGWILSDLTWPVTQLKFQMKLKGLKTTPPNKNPKMFKDNSRYLDQLPIVLLSYCPSIIIHTVENELTMWAHPWGSHTSQSHMVGPQSFFAPQKGQITFAFFFGSAKLTIFFPLFCSPFGF